MQADFRKKERVSRGDVLFSAKNSPLQNCHPLAPSATGRMTALVLKGEGRYE